MMKHEFEKIINTTVSDEDYEKIETAYMTFDHLFLEKEDIAKFYMLNGIAVIERLLKEAEYIESLRSINCNLTGNVNTLAFEQIKNKRLLDSANMTIAGLKEENNNLKTENKILKRTCKDYDTLLSVMEILNNVVCYECETDKRAR